MQAVILNKNRSYERSEKELSRQVIRGFSLDKVGENMRVVVVGVCASGKTTLVTHLKALGVDAYNVAQEHSCIRDFWRKRQPDVLVLLDVTLPIVRRRRDVPWGEERLSVQRERLGSARANADLYIQTDNLSREQVVETVLDYIRRKQDNGGNNGNRSETRP